jgi:soluble lytic murein transglycosylase-like protein
MRRYYSKNKMISTAILLLFLGVLLGAALKVSTVQAQTPQQATAQYKKSLKKNRRKKTLSRRVKRSNKRRRSNRKIKSKRRKTRRKYRAISRHKGSSSGVRAVKVAARKHGVPVKLALSISKKESGHRCNIRGRAGEYGVMQIMPRTARGVRYRGNLSRLLGCSVGAEVAMRYLKRCYRLANRNSYKTKLCYNGGPGAIRRPKKSTIRYARSN